MLSEEITRLAQTELQSCETERQKPEKIKEVSSDEPLSDEDDEQINSIGMHKKIYRNFKYDFFMPNLRRLALFSIRRILERNKLFNAEDHAWSLVLSSPKCEFDDALFFRRFPKSIKKIVNNGEAENNKEGSDKDIFSISANNMEESEQDKSNREFEQTALRDILNNSAQGNKERQDINAENNEGKDNSNKRVSEESNESLMGRIVKRYKFK